MEPCFCVFQKAQWGLLASGLRSKPERLMRGSPTQDGCTIAGSTIIFHFSFTPVLLFVICVGSVKP